MKLIAAFICLFTVIPCEAQIIYVDTNAPGTNNGSSWVNAYNYLQDALLTASSVDEIRIAGGIYRPDRSLSHPNGTKSRTATFQLIDGITINGSYAGFDQPDPNERNVSEYTTVLSGDVNDDDEPNFINYTDNSYHVVSFSGTTDAVLLDGLTITAGNSDGPSPHDRGSGVYNDRGTLEFIDCIISYNLVKASSSNALAYCSGFYNYKGTVSLTGCSISNNKSIGYLEVAGPAIYNVNGTMDFNDCNFVSNLAIGGDGGGEAIGCISNYQDDQWGDSHVRLYNCIFSDNRAIGGDGGGRAIGCIYNFAWRNSRSFLTVIDCKFLDNQAIGGDFGGDAIGCIFNKSIFENAVVEVNIVQSVFSKNQSIVLPDICLTGDMCLACFTLIGASHQLRRFFALWPKDEREGRSI